jgi:hypothetical protein
MSIALNTEDDSERKPTWNLLEILKKIQLSKCSSTIFSPSRGEE